MCLKPSFFFRIMCAKDTPYIQKLFGGRGIIMIVVIIIMGVYIGISGSAEANVEMSSDQNEAVIQQSSGTIFLRSMVLIWVQKIAMVVG